jgi:hypothetical protein
VGSVSAVLGLGAAVLLFAAPAYGRPLRPRMHVDRYGRVLEDVCPEQSPGQRRCYAQRVVPPGTRPARVRPARGGTSSDPNCQSQGGGGGGFFPPGGTMTPTDVIAAYNIPANTSGKGKIIALVELPSTNALSDVNAYRQAFNIPQLAACPTDSKGVPTPNGTPCFARVGEDGTVNSVGTDDCPGWSGETGLDMDMVSAACPDCSIVLVEATTTDDLSQMNKVAATVLKPAAVSNSWGGAENGPGQDDESPFNNPTTLTFVASGDSGYMDEDDNNGQIAGSDFPSSSPYVVAVGGTTLMGGGGGGYSEVVWNDDAQQSGAGAGGSGCSGEFAMPSYQSASGFSFGSCAMRASVDLAAAAEFNPPGGGGGGGGGFGNSGGIAAYDADDQGWNSVVGTSAACPLVAAIMTRVGLAGKDNHELFYKHIDAFHDVTDGTNDNDGLCSDVMCNAGAGWDGPSGLGTPDATKLAALASASSASPDAGTSRDAGADGDSPDATLGQDDDAGFEGFQGGGGATQGASGGGTNSGGWQGQGAPAEQPSPGSSHPRSSGCAVSPVPGTDGPSPLAWLGIGLAAFGWRVRVRRNRRG